ncbi:uncharacterized protein IFT43 [Chironomus tepperi]|uniref:uncharacterized protein IFT43 n=1 Tax=Chironomus tepperi TaxID=113505 RepID=UPI00391FB6CD
MSAPTPKKQGWMDEFKKSSSKKNIFENIEKERFLNSLDNTSEIDIPEIDDVEVDEQKSEPVQNKSAYRKELNVEILKSSSINLDDKVDLTILLEVLENESDIEEKDEVWTWNQLFTKVTAEIADEK